MRSFQTLDQVNVDAATGILYIKVEDDTEMHPRISMRKEGLYLAISASYGPLEIALRPNFDKFTRLLSQLSRVEGLQTTRQVGTGNAYIAMGLHAEGGLVIRPTIVADASGHFSFNLFLTEPVRHELYKWCGLN